MHLDSVFVLVSIPTRCMNRKRSSRGSPKASWWCSVTRTQKFVLFAPGADRLGTGKHHRPSNAAPPSTGCVTDRVSAFASVANGSDSRSRRRMWCI
jgi:hypothetical protein